jgi:hypothetical protein
VRQARSRLHFPGKFVALGAVADLPEDVDPWCVWCFSSCEDGMVPGYLHMLTNRVVCARCMGDPWGNQGRVGQEMGRRVMELARDQDVEVW